MGCIALNFYMAKLVISCTFSMFDTTSSQSLTVFTFHLSLSSGFRSSLGEYHKDTRNLKRLKDSSKFTCQTVYMTKSEFLQINHCDLRVWFMFLSLALASSAIRFRLLKHTRLNVVAFLNELPKTQHDIASFTVDVNTYTVSSSVFCQPAPFICLFLLL